MPDEEKEVEEAVPENKLTLDGMAQGFHLRLTTSFMIQVLKTK